MAENSLFLLPLKDEGGIKSPSRVRAGLGESFNQRRRWSYVLGLDPWSQGTLVSWNTCSCYPAAVL